MGDFTKQLSPRVVPTFSVVFVTSLVMPQRYEIRERIGRGGIGAVYRAFDAVMGREVAIKRLLPLEQTSLNESADESLQREAAALARFQHPNVLTIFAFESDDEGPYVVTELLNGENLKEVIKRGALTMEDFDDLVKQTLDPLVAAQQMNLLHRDLKPQNIMLNWLASGRFQIKILDFGLAKFTQAPSKQTLDQTGSFLGSIDYIAPEQLELEPLDQRTDLYALGCVFYYCLTQRAPFAADSTAKTIQNHLNHKTTPLLQLRPDLPGPVGAWVMRLVSRRPEHRPANALAALREFEQAKSGVAMISPVGILDEEPPPPPQAISPPAQDRPTSPQRRLITGPVKQTPASPQRGLSQPIRSPTQPTRPHTGGVRPQGSKTSPQRGATGAVRQYSQPIRAHSQPQPGQRPHPGSGPVPAGSGDPAPWWRSAGALAGAALLVAGLLYGYWAFAGGGNAAVRCRYVQIVLPGNGTLSLAEVRVFSAGQNVANRGKARQSSVVNSGFPEKAIDLDTDGNNWHTYTHTADNRDQPWWELDLGQEYPVEAVEVFNRTSDQGRYASRLEGFGLILLDERRREVFKKEGNPAPPVSVRFDLRESPSDPLALAPLPVPSPDVLPPPPPSPCENPATAPVSPLLPVTQGLIAYYSASDWVIGPDHKTPARTGEAVMGWGNLAAKSPDHLLVREDPTRAPTLEQVGPSQYPELKATFPMLRFKPKDALRTPDRRLGEVLDTVSVTYFIVHRQDAALRCAMARFHLEQVNDQIALDWKPDGYGSLMNKGLTRVGVDPKLEPGDVHRFHVVSVRWAGPRDEQTVAVTLPDRRRIVSPMGDAPHDVMRFTRYNLGHGGNAYDGHYAAWIIYNRALDDAEMAQVEKSLCERYFAP